jgi:hypothetical protein
MTSSPIPIASAIRHFRRGMVFGVLSLMAAGAFSNSLLAQNAPPANTDTGAAATDNGNGYGRRRGNFTPEAVVAALKDQFGVTDDAEWSLISTRISAVVELRTAAGGGGGGIRVNALGRGGRFGRNANPELDALRTAVTDNMPDAEIKARVDHYREVRKQNQDKLEKAQEDLRAVLTVRQEAIAVMVGLLP